MNLELKRIIDQVSRDKGIEKDLLIGAIKDAIRSAAKKKHGPRLEIEVEYRDDTGEIEVFQYKAVVGEVKDPGQEISLEEGRKMDPECEVGDSLGVKLDRNRAEEGMSNQPVAIAPDGKVTATIEAKDVTVITFE